MVRPLSPSNSLSGAFLQMNATPDQDKLFWVASQLRFIRQISYALTVGCALFAIPSWAHEVEVAGEVAGIWHIEPNHNPKAGEPTTVWVALTRKGGQLLPLEQATCQLSVYTQPRKPGDQPLLQPPVKAIAAEQYQGIPAAEVRFPKTGLYQLQLSCSPKTTGAFQPFQMDYQVTVAQSGSTPVAPTDKSLQPAQAATRRNLTLPRAVTLTIAGIAAAGLTVLLIRSRQQHR